MATVKVGQIAVSATNACLYCERKTNDLTTCDSCRNRLDRGEQFCSEHAEWECSEHYPAGLRY